MKVSKALSVAKSNIAGETSKHSFRDSVCLCLLALLGTLVASSVTVRHADSPVPPVG